MRSDEFAAVLADPDEWFILLPIGAIEQHGDHLPVDVDIHASTAVCEVVAERDPKVIVAPALPFGFSAAQTYRPGTITLASTTLLSVLGDTCRSILDQGFKNLLIVNGHNGNKWMMGQCVTEIPRRTDVFVGGLTYFDLSLDAFTEHRISRLGGEGHSGELETALELYTRAELVTDERAVRYVTPTSAYGFVDLAVRGPLAGGGRKPTSPPYPEGVMGDPSVATGELGKLVVEAAVTGINEIIAEARGQADPSQHPRATGAVNGHLG
jgi:creatinine amidohydrolase/Fe(II)-dependent formamide hydrolase-like protein